MKMRKRKALHWAKFIVNGRHRVWLGCYHVMPGCYARTFDQTEVPLKHMKLFKEAANAND